MPQGEEAPAFGRYRDAVMLGSGGMGAVYRATDPSLDRYVAIKVLTHREPRYVERFRREAQVLAKIMHPSIIQIYEIVGTDEDQSDPYIVMEFFDGKPLDTLLKDGTLSEPQVVNVLRQTAEGLRKAHANHVIHRDIKPANIMVSDSGEVKILDFGIAKLRDAKKDLTGKTVLGTPYYMSPEQAMGQPIDARTDIYSLGITAFHLLTGRKPFEAKSKVDVMLMQVKTPLPAIAQFVPCDEQVVQIVGKMCAKKADQRYQSCGELIEALDALPRSLGGKQMETPATLKSTLKAPPPPLARASMPTPAKQQTPPAPKVPSAGARPPPRAPSRPTSRPERKPPAAAAAGPAGSRLWLGVAAGAGAAVVVLGLLAFFLARGGGASSQTRRVPAKGWMDAGTIRKIQSAGGYGNCVFSSREIERGKEDESALRDAFTAGEPIFGRCYFARKVGPNRPGEVWQEVWIDGVKRAQVIYDPALPPDEDQLRVEVGKSRLGNLSGGKHTLDLWIYRQPADADNPVPLAAGELVVRK